MKSSTKGAGMSSSGGGATQAKGKMPAGMAGAPGDVGASSSPMTPTGAGSTGMGGGAGGAGMGGLQPQPPTQRRCAAVEVHYRLLRESPQYAQARLEIENAALEFRSGVRALRARGVVRIPTVVHVVWKTAAQNISEAQITSQIDVINRDFRRLNADVANVPAVWQSLVADTQVEFFLATQDPNGNPTTGITRTSTNVNSFNDDDRMKSAATGGADAWPTDRYLNIWVCQLGGGLLGYAQFPGGPAATDGVVITHTGFGTTGTAAAPFNLGRTATHEIGHWLNLFHIWGDERPGEDPCSRSDLVNDTPNQGGPNYNKPNFPTVSCSNGPNGDMFINYMDYVDDDTMFMFTVGQLARINACLEGPRSSFLANQVATAQPGASGRVVAWGAERLDAFVLGTDSAVYHKWWDGAAWGPSLVDYEYMGGVCMSSPEAVAWGPNRLDVFVLGTDRALYHKWWDGATWAPSLTDWEYMGGICASPPKVVAWGPNRLDVFVLGADRALYHKWWDGTAWGPSLTDWEYMGGVCASPPEVVAWGPNRLDVFVLGTDRALYHKWWDGTTWGPSLTDWEYMGGICSSPPKVVAWGPDRLDVFVTGTDSALYHKWWDGATWGPSLVDYEYMGGICSSPPEVVTWGPNRLDVFVTGTDSALYHKWWNGATWGPSLVDYEYMGGICSSPPRVVAWGPDRLDVFVTGTDSALYHKWWNGAAWGPSLVDYEYMGGIIQDF